MSFSMMKKNITVCTHAIKIVNFLRSFFISQHKEHDLCIIV